MALFKNEAAETSYLKSEKINEEILLHTHETWCLDHPAQRQQTVTSTSSSFISPLQTGQTRVKCRQAVSRRGTESSERKSRQQDAGSRRSGGWFLGRMTREWLLLPQAPLHLPSITRVHFQRSTVGAAVGGRLTQTLSSHRSHVDALFSAQMKFSEELSTCGSSGAVFHRRSEVFWGSDG